MEINRNNYELFFLLYTDNELSAAERIKVEHFVTEHQDLKNELAAILQTRLAPCNSPTFPYKENLYKISGGGIAIHEGNYEAYFVQYGDNELCSEDQKAVEQFLELHPSKQREFDLLLQTRCQPEPHIVFPDKTSLYIRSGKTIPVVLLHWRRIAAAAAIVALGSWLWMNAGDFVPAQQVEKDSPITAELQYIQPENQQQNSERGNPAPETTAPESLVQVAGNESSRTSADLSPRTTGSVIHHRSDDLPAKKDHALRTEVNETMELISFTNTDADKLLLPDIPVTEILQQKNIPAMVLDDVAHPLAITRVDAGKSLDRNKIDEAELERSLTYWDVHNTEKKPRGIFRGLLRRASRVVDHMTNPDTNENQSVVRVAGFEIVKK